MYIVEFTCSGESSIFWGAFATQQQANAFARKDATAQAEIQDAELEESTHNGELCISLGDGANYLVHALQST